MAANPNLISKGSKAAALFQLLSCLLAAYVCGGCAPSAKDSRTAIRFIAGKQEHPQLWDEIIAAFEAEHPGLKVIMETGPASSTAFHDLLTQKLKNQSPEADVFFMDVVWPPEFAAAGWAEPLDSWFPAAERADFIAEALRANTWKERIYGVPLFIDSGLLYYRSDLLARYGFQPPATWQDMALQADAIVSGEARQGSALYGLSIQFKQYEGLVCTMMEFIVSNRGELLDPMTGRPAIESPAALQAVAFVRDRLIGSVAPRGVLTYEEPESLAVFLQGRAVFHRNWPHAGQAAEDPRQSRIVGRFGVTRLPHFPGGESHGAIGGWQLGISSFSRNKDAAWAFIRFLTGARVQKLLALKAGLAPSRRPLYDDTEIMAASPRLAGMRDVLAAARARPRSPLYPALSHVLQRYFSLVLADPQADLAAEARTAAREMARVLELAGAEG